MNEMEFVLLLKPCLTLLHLTVRSTFPAMLHLHRIRFFTARRYASAVYAMALCLSVRPAYTHISNSSIVLKRLQ